MVAEVWDYTTGEGRGRTDVVLDVLLTGQGRSIRVTSEPDMVLGRVYHRVEKVGTFTIAVNDGLDVGRAPKDRDGYRLLVTYGRHDEDGYASGYEVLPDAPRIFGIDLVGGTVTDPANLPDKASRYSWPVARRRTSWCTAECVPNGTQERTGDILAAVVRHHMARPDRQAVDAVHAARRAPGIIAGFRRDIARLDEEIATRSAERRALRLRIIEQSAHLTGGA